MEMCYDGALVMPSNYVMMNEEEMTYLEGGKFYGVDLTAKECEDFATTLGALGLSFTVTALVGGVIGLIPTLQAALVAAKFLGKLATATTIGWAVFDYCGRNNGMRIGFESSTKEFVFSIL